MALCPKKTPFPLPQSLSLSSFLAPSKSMSTKCSNSELLNRNWMLSNPAAQIHKISLSNSPSLSYSINPNPILPPRFNQEESKGSSFYVVRDDLLHPLINGNKARKLDALIPMLQNHSINDVVTCGGCQSAHTAALAVCCAERGMRSHLLLRGEQPEIATGYNLVSLMYGNVKYVARSKYAQREEMLTEHANLVSCDGGCVIHVDDILASDSGDTSLKLDCSMHIPPQVKSEIGVRRVVIVSEGAGDAIALLGLIRFVKYLSQPHVFGKEQNINLVVDAGTGTTAIGLALGALYFGLPWKVTAIMLADTIEKYKEKERWLISDFRRIYQSEFLGQTVGEAGDSIVQWVERSHPRKFGKVLKGEIQLCRKISQETGILLDPVYTLAAWEQAILSLAEVEDSKVVMLHTGGTLGLFGLAQRYTSDFHPRDQTFDILSN
ncbi:uncharacterized protein A4U43_C05F27970 [Asparagus officinalis]|uniref:Uncharacterized protein n=1 Tax=Asparagus officinalis TaxID=4686 RepID=A0A5P1EV09_ASPOF|nr:putative D-cysteine desulfhydrase 2, mitochondrial [Asparagus officinalis]ONK69895.1 uncharacterized protein A4U43_C05F27970 [Asparagus officinalis]